MTIQQLIIILERFDGTQPTGARRAAADLATDLRNLCDEFALRGQKAKTLPGEIRAIHAIALGVEATIEAHTIVEEARERVRGERP